MSRMPARSQRTGRSTGGQRLFGDRRRTHRAAQSPSPTTRYPASRLSMLAGSGRSTPPHGPFLSPGGPLHDHRSEVAQRSSSLGTVDAQAVRMRQQYDAAAHAAIAAATQASHMSSQGQTPGFPANTHTNQGMISASSTPRAATRHASVPGASSVVAHQHNSELLRDVQTLDAKLAQEILQDQLDAQSLYSPAVLPSSSRLSQPAPRRLNTSRSATPASAVTLVRRSRRSSSTYSPVSTSPRSPRADQGATAPSSTTLAWPASATVARQVGLCALMLGCFSASTYDSFVFVCG